MPRQLQMEYAVCLIIKFVTISAAADTNSHSSVLNSDPNLPALILHQLLPPQMRKVDTNKSLIWTCQ